MEALNAFSTLAFILVGTAVGVRLLMLASRTRQLPEASIGGALVLIGAIGYPIAVAATIPDLLDPKTGVALLAVCGVVIDIGFTLIAVFTWRVFRHEAPWARTLLVVLTAAYAVHAVGNWAAAIQLQNPADVLKNLGWATYGQILNFTTFAWTAIEAYRYWWMLRKRAALGLGDPVTTNRFFLWAIAGTCSVCTNLLTWMAIARGLDFFMQTGLQTSVALISVGSCVAQYLAFLPPKAYVERLRARAAA